MTQIAHSSVLSKSCKRTVFGLLQHHNKIFQFLKNKSEGGLLVLVIKAKDIEDTKIWHSDTSMDSQRRTISLILTSCKICLQPPPIYFQKHYTIYLSPSSAWTYWHQHWPLQGEILLIKHRNLVGVPSCMVIRQIQPLLRRIRGFKICLLTLYVIWFFNENVTMAQFLRLFEKCTWSWWIWT